MFRAVRAWLLVSLVVTIGCSGRGCGKTNIEPEPPKVKKPATTTPAVQTCLDGVRALTEYTDRCEGGREWWGSIERAVEQLRPACEVMTVAPGAVYDRKLVDACIAALAKQPCGAPSPEACHIAGTRKHGEGCAFPVQCERGAFCKIGQDSICGVCAPTAKVGEGCLDAVCDDGLTCLGDKCGKPKEVGEACMGDQECKRMLFCEAGKCRELRAVGQTCVLNECAPGAMCEAGLCKKRPPPGKPGEKCQNSLECLDFSCSGGTCRPLGELGADCDVMKDMPPCAPSLVCHKNKCALPDAHACP